MPGTALALAAPSTAALPLSGRIFVDVKRGGGHHRRPPPRHHGDGHWRGAGEAVALLRNNALLRFGAEAEPGGVRAPTDWW